MQATSHAACNHTLTAFKGRGAGVEPVSGDVAPHFYKN